MSRLVDLSPTVPDGFKGPPSTDLGVELDVRVRSGAGAFWQSAGARLSTHTGTHVESARHISEEGETIDEVALDRVIGPAVVLDLTPLEERELIGPDVLERAVDALEEPPRPGEILLLRTDWATRAIGSPEYFRRSPALTEAAAEALVALRPRCIGCDFFEEPAAREPGWEASDFVVHRTILGAGVPLVEGLVLSLIHI